MVCVESGDVIEFFNEEMESLQRKMAEKHGFELLDHSLVLYVRPRKSDSTKE
jgi:Fur family ferric uptake transcriptional regulator